MNKVKTSYLVSFRMKDKKVIHIRMFDKNSEAKSFINTLYTKKINKEPYNVHDSITNHTFNLSVLDGKYRINKIALINKA
jgi:cytochrome oxidase Cu insertion factor (SCO1/SenC/PrrC family)